jgi:hypothetical protein
MVGAVRGAEPSVERSAADRRAAASSQHSAGGSTACARTVVCLRLEDERTCVAMGLPVRAVMRAQTFSRSNGCGTE